MYALFLLSFTYFVSFMYARFGNNFFIQFLVVFDILLILYIFALISSGVYFKNMNLFIGLFVVLLVYFGIYSIIYGKFHKWWLILILGIALIYTLIVLIV